MVEKLRIDIVTSAIVPAPKYLNTFVEYFVEEAKKQYDLLDEIKSSL